MEQERRKWEVDFRTAGLSDFWRSRLLRYQLNKMNSMYLCVCERETHICVTEMVTVRIIRVNGHVKESVCLGSQRAEWANLRLHLKSVHWFSNCCPVSKRSSIQCETAHITAKIRYCLRLDKTRFFLPTLSLTHSHFF